jgi:PAS domain S-box-containing protein
VVLQVVAAILAIRLIPLTGRRWAWILVAAAILLIIPRRCIAIYTAVETPPAPLDALEASVNLVISFLLMVGVWLIRPMFLQFSQTQNALKESEATARRQAQELEQIYRYAPIGLAVADRDLRFLRVNEMQARNIGRTVEEIEGKTIPEIFPEIMPKLWEFYAPVLNEGRAVLGVEILGVRSKDGSVGDRLASYFPLKSDTGEVVGIIAAVLDITDRKRTEDALRQSEQNYREIFNSTSDALYIHDQTGLLLDVNQRMCEMFGCDRETALRANPDDLSLGEPPYSPENADQYIRRALEGKPQVFEWRSRRYKGELFWSEVALRAWNIGGRKRVIASVRDITERKQVEQELLKYRKGLEELVAQRTVELDRTINELRREAQSRERAEAELRESERRYRLLFEQSPVALWEEDFTAAKAEFHALAAAGVKDWAAYFREHPQEVARIAQTIRILNVNQATLKTLGARTREELLDNLPRLLASQSSSELGLYLECFARGETTCFHEMQGPDFQGRQRHFSVRWAIVESRESGMVRVLVSQEDITEQKQAEQSLRTIAHKLIAVREEERRRVATDLHDSLAQGLVAMKLSLHASNLNSAMEQCDRLIHEVREICHDLYPPVLERLGLASGLTQLAEAYEPSISVTVEYAYELSETRFDKNLEITIYRIAQEAINNAVRHGKAGQIEVELAMNDGHLSLSVADNGCGFDVAGKNRLGLGLLTMKGRITAIGGTLDITSKPGQTVVRATAPLPQNA